MAKVYISNKVQTLIEPYQHLLPTYQIIGNNEKLKKGYIIVCSDEVDQFRFKFYNTAIIVGGNKDTFNVIEADPLKVAYLIQSLCCSTYDHFENQHIQIKCSEAATICDVEAVNTLNRYMDESLLLNLDRFVFCSTFVTLSVLIYISVSNKISILSNQTYEQAMPLCIGAYMIYGLSLVFNYIIEKNNLKKKCKLIKNKGNIKNLYYISNEIEGIDFE